MKHRSETDNAQRLIDATNAGYENVQAIGRAVKDYRTYGREQDWLGWCVQLQATLADLVDAVAEARK
jgi:nitrogen fixation/metabolism regulation signal transduction histidine kinase